jgi:AAA domain
MNFFEAIQNFIDSERTSLPFAENDYRAVLQHDIEKLALIDNSVQRRVAIEKLILDHQLRSSPESLERLVEQHLEALEGHDKFTALIEKLDRIFTESESASAQRWELIRLAKSTKIPIKELTGIYDAWRDDREEIKPMTLSEFRALTPDKREWLIASILPAQTTGLVHSAPGTGKTLLFYDFAKAVATGSPWNGYPTQKGKVLIVQTDEPTSETRDRFEVSGMFDEVEDGQILVLSQWGFSQIRKLERWVEDFKPSLIVIDSLSTANRRSGHEEKDVQYGHGLIDLRDLADKHRCSIWVLHHSNKSGTTRGSTALEANVSEVWRIRTGEQKEDLAKTQRVLSVGKSRAGCTGEYLLELDVENFSWAWHGEHTLAKQTRSNPGAELLSFLTLNSDQWFEPEELAQRGFGGGSRDAVRKQCKRLERSGLVRSEERVKKVPGFDGTIRFSVFQGIRCSECADATQNKGVRTQEAHIPGDSQCTDATPLGHSGSEIQESAQKNTMSVSQEQASAHSFASAHNFEEHYPCIPETNVQRSKIFNNQDSERWTHEDGKASSARNDANSLWMNWTKINTQVEVLDQRNDKARIRVPGEARSQWVPISELKEKDGDP